MTALLQRATSLSPLVAAGRFLVPVYLRAGFILQSRFASARSAAERVANIVSQSASR